MSSKQQLQLPRKIIYIMSPGRCGSTLLEVLLSNSNGIAGCGELTHIFRDGFISNQRCSCGELTYDCKKWSERLKKSGWNSTNIIHLSKLFSFFSSHILFSLIFIGLSGKARRIEYAVANETLLSSIADTTQGNVIVDSSKYAGRALELAAQYPDKVYIISLTRAPAGVLHSFSKIVAEQMPKSTLATLLYYCYVLLCMRLVCWRRGLRVRRISYESLCSSPVSVLCEIEDFCGINLEQTKIKLESDAPLKIDHIVTGNRLRHQRTIDFRCTPEEYSTSVRTQLAATLMSAWRKLLHL